MRLAVLVISVYSICNQVKTQIYFPDDEYLKQISTSPPNTYQGRSYSILNPLNNIPQTIAAHDGYSRTNQDTIHRTAVARHDNLEEIVNKGVSNLALSINNYYLYKSSNNIIFSPVSITGALALVLLGSYGKTFDEIASVMGLMSRTDINRNSEAVHENLGNLFLKLNGRSLYGEQIKLAAAVFVQNNYQIRSLYRQTSEQIYRNEIVNADFRHNNIQAQYMINKWVSDKTNGKIKSILPNPPSQETKVIILSALYFNGAWEKQFWSGFTRKRSFYPNGRKTSSDIKVDMMSNGGYFPYYKDRTLQCDIMGFPYKGNATTMYVIIPQDSNIQRLKSFEASLTSDDILRLIRNTEDTQSVVLFPKMKLESSSDLTQPLQNLGIKSLFNPLEANLAVLSSGLENRHQIKGKEITRGYNPIPQIPTEPPIRNLNDVLIFNRFGSPSLPDLNCTHIFNPNSNMTECEETDRSSQRQVMYKKFGDKLGRRVIRGTEESLDELRFSLNKNSHMNHEENPGIYADSVLHKVYIDVTEEGTEAAASTSVSLNRGGDINIFRADVPFVFFIWHEETKLILFWGTIYEPTPSYS